VNYKLNQQQQQEKKIDKIHVTFLLVALKSLPKLWGTHTKKINNTDIKLPEDMTVIVLSKNDMIELFRKDTLRELENLDKYKNDQTLDTAISIFGY